MKPLMLN